MEFLQTQLRSLQKLTRRVNFFFSHKDEDKKRHNVCATHCGIFFIQAMVRTQSPVNDDE